ncbi:MAG: hypothetical protein Q4P65_03390 [Eubacteriales bacterium]|nr:hypothetical protein [Eubacteriales bacterium]
MKQDYSLTKNWRIYLALGLLIFGLLFIPTYGDGTNAKGLGMSTLRGLRSLGVSVPVSEGLKNLMSLIFFIPAALLSYNAKISDNRKISKVAFGISFAISVLIVSAYLISLVYTAIAG